MIPRDRRKLLAAVAGLLPPNWRAYETSGPNGVALLPPTGMARTGPIQRWPGPHAMPSGLGLCRVLATADHARHFGDPGDRVVLVVGLPGDRRMRRIRGELTGRGWVRVASRSMAATAWELHFGRTPDGSIRHDSFGDPCPLTGKRWAAAWSDRTRPGFFNVCEWCATSPGMFEVA